MRPALVALSLLATGCASTTTHFTEVTVSGTARLHGAAGPVEVQLHFAEQGEGELAHPLGEIERFEATVGEPFEHVFDYPSDEGTGLVIYAWHDADGDGAHCAPDGDEEASGLVEVEDFPAYSVEVELVLDSVCEGPEGLFP